MPDKAHSDYGGSVAEKWLACPGYYNAVKDLPPQPENIHTAGGTAQHELNELIARTGKDPAEFIGKPWMGVGAEFASNTYDEDNVARARVWFDTIVEHFDPMLFKLEIEEKFVLSSIDAELFGSCDLAAINIPDKILGIIDYKDGAGKIVSVDSPQPRFYAVGADDTLGLGIDASWKVIYGIVQPKAPTPVTFHETTGADVIEWRGIFRHAWKRSKEADAPRVAGSHCHWCRAAGTCSALAESKRLSVRREFAGEGSGPIAPHKLTQQQIANILRVKPEVESWLEDVAKHALEAALAGNVPPGFRVGEGRAGNRKWKDEQSAEEALHAALGDAAYEKKLLTPAKAEKALGKAKAGMLSDLVTQDAGKPCLVPEGSERDNYSKLTQARAEFSV